MPYVDIPLNGFAPDLDPATPGAFQSCLGFEATRRGWRLQRDVTTVATSATALETEWRDGLVSKTADGTEVVHGVHLNSSGQFGLFRSNAGVLTECARAALPTYNASGLQQWSLCQWGNLTLATNLLDTLQIRDATTAAAFADSAATGIPKAQIAVTWGPPTAPRVILLHYNDGTEYYDGWWSGHQGGPTLAWTANIATQSANGRLLGAGPISCGIAYRDTIIAFGQDQMWVGVFDPNTIINWQRLTDDVGCIGMYAAKVVNGILYFLSKKGLYYYDGSYPRRMDLPIQDYLVATINNANGPTVSNILMDTQLNADSQAQRLLITFRGLVAAVLTANAVLSINLLSNKVGQLKVASSAIQSMLDNKYRVLQSAGSIYLKQESSVPIVTAGTIELPYLGTDSEVSLLRRIYPRFASAFGGGVVTIAASVAPLAAANDAPAWTALAAVTASPWRIDTTQSAKWHRTQLTCSTSVNTNDPELIGCSVELVEAGKE